jgi:hypothetical protein
MHYRNGREAHNGDKVIRYEPTTGHIAKGVLTNAVPGGDYCNGFLWPDAVWVNLRDCLHMDDFAALWPADTLIPS